jgi:hypothetical protein
VCPATTGCARRPAVACVARAACARALCTLWLTQECTSGALQGTNAIHGMQNVQCLPAEHGGKCPTSFAAPVTLAASFNMSLVEDMGNVIGKELRAYYNAKVHNSLDTWSPTININRDPRWGRNVESERGNAAARYVCPPPPSEGCLYICFNYLWQRNALMPDILVSMTGQIACQRRARRTQRSDSASMGGVVRRCSARTSGRELEPDGHSNRLFPGAACSTEICAVWPEL